jgi:hypothetical protein
MKPTNQLHQLNHHDKKKVVFTNIGIVAKAKRANGCLYNRLNKHPVYQGRVPRKVRQPERFRYQHPDNPGKHIHP